MNYSFKVMTDEELNALLPEGVYSFEVAKSTKKTSKAGNDMAELSLSVWDNGGKVTYVRDFLIFSSVPLNIRKIKHFCDAVGLSDAYNKGELQEDLERLAGKVKIGIEEEQPKADGGYWPKKNIVIDYVKLSGTEAKAKNDPKKDDKPFQDDDLPF